MASNRNTLAARRWAREVRALAREMPARAFQERLFEIAFKLLEVAAQNSPVDTGRLRNGWHVTINQASGADSTAGQQWVAGKTRKHSTGPVLAAGAGVLRKARLGDRVVIQNNVPYALVIEHGLFRPPDPGPSKDRRPGRLGRVLVAGGYSVQAPNGMLGDALQVVRAAYAARR